jgi:alpha-tubulin suppressor-like RCC1 family protein
MADDSAAADKPAASISDASSNSAPISATSSVSDARTASNSLDLVPYPRGELVRYHAFLPSGTGGAASNDDQTAERGDAEAPRRPPLTEVLSWGGSGELGVLMRGTASTEDTSPLPPAPVPRLARRTIVDISASAFTSAALSDTGEVFLAGLNDEGQLTGAGSTGGAGQAEDGGGAGKAEDGGGAVAATDGDHGSAIVSVPVLAEALSTHRIAQVAAGDHHTVVLSALTRLALSFGSNEYGALGHSADVAPVATGASPAPVSGGQLTSTGPYRLPPRVVRGLGGVKLAQVACGPTHTLCLSRDGVVFAMGSGVRGALGTGDRGDRTVATRVPGLAHVPIAHVAAGDNYSVAVSVPGLAYAWGANKAGQCGLPVTAYPHAAYAPTRVEGLSELVQQVACGEAHTLWTSRSGRLYACGRNGHGQLGLGLPLAAAAASLTAAAGGAGEVSSAVAADAAATLHSFVDVPSLVAALQHVRVREAACGARHSLVLTADGTVFAMGDSTDGQTGVLLPRPQPARATLPSPPGDGTGAPPSGPPSPAPEAASHAAAAGPVPAASLPNSWRGCLWAPTRIPELSGVGVFRLAAGGDHSLALRITRGGVVSVPPGVLPRGAMSFMDTVALARLGRYAAESQNFAPLKAAIRDLFSHPSIVNGSFLAQNDSLVFEAHAANGSGSGIGGSVGVASASAAPLPRA